GVARKADHFHAVLKRRWNRVQYVRGGDEENLGKIVFDVQIMIHEHEVLFRIEDFEQRGRWVAAEVGRHLVDFVEHEHWVAHASLLHHLKNLTGKRTDIGPAMPANFSFIANAAK